MKLQLARRLMVMVDAIRDMQCIVLTNAHRGEGGEQIFEVVSRRLVRTNVLSCHDGVKVNSELLICGSETAVVHIGDDNQLEIFLQILQRTCRVWECRPVSN